MRIVPFVVSMIVLLAAVGRAARAETLEAPIGGAVISLGTERVACSKPADGWTVEAAGHGVKPPASAAVTGSVVDLRVARSAAECAQSVKTPAIVKLVATAPWPALDKASFRLSVDEGRLTGRGRPLAGVQVSWPSDLGLTSDACHEAKPDGPVETCTWAVPKTVAADPSASTLRWWPAGALVAADATLFGADGSRATPATFTIVPSRVEIMDLLPPNASVDVSSGTGRAPLVHPDVIAGVDCGVLRCSVENGTLVVQAPPASVSAVDVKLRLAPHVYYARKTPPDPQPTIHVSVLRCPMSVASGPPIRGVDGTRAVVRVEGACMQGIADLAFLSGSQRVDVEQVVTTKDASYAVLDLGNVHGASLSISAMRNAGDEDATVVAMAHVETAPAPVVRTSLEIGGFPPIDFIPNNRRAIVHVPHVPNGQLVVLSVTDVYDADVERGIPTVEGNIDAVGLVALQFGVRMPALPPPLDALNLTVLSDALQRNVKEANIPAPFGLTAESKAPLAEVVCRDLSGTDHRLVPGVPLHLPFDARFGCRAVLHRERLSPEYGTQKLTLEVEVDKVDGSSRNEAHVTQMIVLRSGPTPRVAWIKGIVSPYDRVVVRLSHIADEAHYLGALDIATGEPSVQWTAVFGTGHARIYATTAIPTGLYRFGTTETSGVLSLSLAVLARFTWLDTNGHEGLLGLEGGLMAFGLSTATGNTLTQVGGIVGVGLSIPIANAGAPAQASINLHAWFEQRLAGSGEAGSAEATSRQAIIFGPSISIGNVGTTF